MRRYINNKRYDTDSAKNVASHEGEILYRKRNGEYFLCDRKENIRVLTYREAKKWAFKNLPACDAQDLFYSKIKEYRIWAGMSQRTLSEKAGVHLSFIGKLERRECSFDRCSVDVAQRIADALGVKVSVLRNENVSTLLDENIEKREENT